MDIKTKNNETRCVFKNVLEDNLNGTGTSFIGRTPEDLPCYHCEGFKHSINACEAYHPEVN